MHKYISSFIIIYSILTLKALDYHVISDDEIIENLYLAGKFRALAKSFYKFLYLPVDEVREKRIFLSSHFL